MFKLCLLLAVVSVASAGRIALTACAGGHSLPDWFESDDCSSVTNRCTLRRGQHFVGRAGVTPSQTFPTLTVDLQATVLGIPFPMEIEDGYHDACLHLEAPNSCPVSSPFVWIVRFPIWATYPAIANMRIQRKLTARKFKRSLINIPITYFTVAIGHPGAGTARAACAIVDAEMV